MGINITGSITVEALNTDDKKTEKIIIEAEEFENVSSSSRNLGDGDYQYEALYKYVDYENRFTISLQTTKFEGEVSFYPPSIDGDANLVEDDLSYE